ncbi:TMEM175 family protein [Mucilaginibacter sp. dw_454]|uniref:TMEM175 family protein n=1 Tax=Mucilaginibacter sp. dw_454 TaxID=2720079 RepID=UPI001BD67646|nr:TMEM175 family protein [Mucilaginibacter sp. dw_454]
MHINEEEEIKKEFQLERVILFTDAVFAIILTIMVLDIKLPEGLKNADLRSSYYAFKQIAIRLIAYFITFMLVGRFWMAHLKLFRYLKDYDRNLLVLNLAFLFSITLFPFAISTWLSEFTLGQFKDFTSLPVQSAWGFELYIAVFLLTVFIHSLIAWYLLRNREQLCVHTSNLENELEWKVTQISLFLAPAFLVVLGFLNFFKLPFITPMIVGGIFGFIMDKLKQHYYPQSSNRGLVMSHLYNYAKNNRFKIPTTRNTIKKRKEAEARKKEESD